MAISRTDARVELPATAGLRVVLVGPLHERTRLRERAEAAGLRVIGEAASASEARAIAGADAMLLPVPSSGPHGRLVEALTPRELQVLELLADGLANKAIAARLEISDQTVKFHVASIYGKLGAANRADAVRRAVRRGLLTV